MHGRTHRLEETTDAAENPTSVVYMCRHCYNLQHGYSMIVAWLLSTYAAAATTHSFLGAEALLGCNTSQHTSSEFHLENINPDRFIPSLDYREGVEKSEFLSRLFKAQNRVFKTRLGNLGLSPKTLPKAQRTRGLSSGYQSNFLRSYHKILNKS